MLLYGLLPFWGQFRQSEVYRRSLPGFNAAAVGLVVMAVFAMYNAFTCVQTFKLSFRPLHFRSRIEFELQSVVDIMLFL